MTGLYQSNKTMDVEKVNLLLKSKELDLPKHRRYVTKSGTNVGWLLRNIGIRNSGEIVDQITSLLKQHPSVKRK